MANHYFDLSHFALLKISGDDAAEFLENQLTTHLEDLDHHGWLLSAWCTPKGRVLANFMLYRQADAYFLILPSMLKQTVMQRLTMYVLRSKVKIDDQQELFSLIGLQGSKLDDLLSQIEPAFSGSSANVIAIENMTLLRFTDPEPRVLLVVGIEAMSHTMNQILMACEESDRSQWSLLDIQTGLPWITAATSEKLLPQMLNLDLTGGLSYQKGCFPGQEIIARVHYRGEVKQRLFIGEGCGEVIPGPGDELENPEGGQLLGDVIDAEPSGDNTFTVLAATRVQSLDEYPAVLRGHPETTMKLRRLDAENG